MLAPTARLTARGAPFEILEAEIDGIPCRVYRHAPKTLADLYRKAERYAQREFIACGQRRLTYGTILERAHVVAGALSAGIDVRDGARVALIGRNRPEWVIGFIAITLMGATAVVIHHAATTEQIIEALDVAECTAVIADEDVARSLSDQGDRRPVLLVQEDGEPPVGSFHMPRDAQAAVASAAGPLAGPVDPEQPALIAFTSGSTGRAKGVVLNHRSVLTGLMNMLLGGAAASAGRPPARGSSPVSLVLAPFSHISGYSNFLLMWHLGGRIVTLAEGSTDDVLRHLEAEGATSLVGATPAMIRELIRLPDQVRHRAGSLRSLNIHGAHLNSGLLAEIAGALPHVTVGTGYGLTETNGSVCVASGPMLLERPGTCGEPLPTVDLRIATEDGTEVPRGETGEIWLRGAMIMQGYCNSAEANARALCKGWLRTGDLGRLDTDGYLHVIDRMTRTIVQDGVEVSCGDVESIVLDARLAAEAAAFVIEDPECGERLVLMVVPREGQDCDSAQVRKELAAAGISAAAMPRILAIDSLPRTTSGKVDGRELRRRYQEN